MISHFLERMHIIELVSKVKIFLYFSYKNLLYISVSSIDFRIDYAGSILKGFFERAHSDGSSTHHTDEIGIVRMIDDPTIMELLYYIS